MTFSTLPSVAAPPASPLAAQIRSLSAVEAAAVLERAQPSEAVEALLELNPAIVQDILRNLEKGSRRFITSSAPPEVAEQWKRNTAHGEGSIGRLMEAPLSVFRPGMTVGEAIEALRPLVRSAFVTYVYVVDGEGRLVGLVTMRDLLFNDARAALADVMLAKPFALSAGTRVDQAMKLTLNRHYPQYPVVDDQGKLVGLVRGAALFEMEAFEITAQAGAMVGVVKEERISTPVVQSVSFRTPWLLINLVTAFMAGGVVVIFQGTVDRLVILATFLPVLMGQAGNTGCQALAVTVRGLTLGDIKAGGTARLMTKETMLGVINGLLSGVLCGVGMWALATVQESPHAAALGLVTCVAMAGSCVIGGISGALVPLGLRRLGADPATASSIVVTTATEIGSMALLLGLATILVR